MSCRRRARGGRVPQASSAAAFVASLGCEKGAFPFLRAPTGATGVFRHNPCQVPGLSLPVPIGTT